MPQVSRRLRPRPGGPCFSPRGDWWSVLERSTHKGLADIPQERSGAQTGPAWAHPEERGAWRGNGTGDFGVCDT